MRRTRQHPAAATGVGPSAARLIESWWRESPRPPSTRLEQRSRGRRPPHPVLYRDATVEGGRAVEHRADAAEERGQVGGAHTEAKAGEVAQHVQKSGGKQRWEAGLAFGGLAFALGCRVASSRGSAVGRAEEVHGQVEEQLERQRTGRGAERLGERGPRTHQPRQAQRLLRGPVEPQAVQKRGASRVQPVSALVAGRPRRCQGVGRLAHFRLRVGQRGEQGLERVERLQRREARVVAPDAQR